MPPGASVEKSSHIVTILKLPKELLKRFPHEHSDSPSTPASTSAADAATPQQHSDLNGAIKTDPATDQENLIKRKGIPGPKPGSKRNAAQMDANAPPKPRGKPGPKKKIKIDGVNGTIIPVSAPKLNPKANQGAINANLRALDRTGKPCRRWERAGFKVKSFTGVVWTNDAAWSAPKKATPDLSADEAKSSQPGTPTADDRKATPEINGTSTPMNGTGAPSTPMTGVENGTSPAPAPGSTSADVSAVNA